MLNGSQWQDELASNYEKAQRGAFGCFGLLFIKNPTIRKAKVFKSKTSKRIQNDVSKKCVQKFVQDIKLLLKKQKDLEAQSNDKKAKAAMSHWDRRALDFGHLPWYIRMLFSVWNQRILIYDFPIAFEISNATKTNVGILRKALL